MSSEREARVRELLGAPVYARLWAAVRERLERTGAGELADGGESLGVLPTPRTVTIRGLDRSEREALANLLGAPAVPGDPIRLSLSRLDRALRESRLELGLVACLELLGGKLENARQRRRTEAADRQRMYEQAAAHPAVAQKPALADWLDRLRAHGLLARAAGAAGESERALLERALTILDRLPAEPPVLLQTLAAETTGDAHGLDPGRPLAGLVAGALASLHADGGAPQSALARRQLFGQAGIVCDDLSSHVLTLGLRPGGPGRLADSLGAAAAAGEPARTTLRELRRHGVALAAPCVVYICENPAVVAAAADALGPRSAPLVCTDGMPSLAVTELLAGLARTGGALYFHSDFDWQGIRIGNLLAGRLGAKPWRFSAGDYLCAATSETAADTLPLQGHPAVASWDEDLAPAMQAHRRAIPEELVLGELLATLRRDPG